MAVPTPIKDTTVWKDRKRPIFGLPWSFTRYALTNKRLLLDVGLLNSKKDQILLYRVMDCSMEQSLLDRIFGVGSIKVISADKSCPTLLIRCVKHPTQVMDLITDAAEQARDSKNVVAREFIDSDGDGVDDGDSDF